MGRYAPFPWMFFKFMPFRKPAHLYARFIPIVFLLCGLVLFFAQGWHHYFTFASLKSHRELLLAYVHAHPFLSAAIFFAVYAGVVSCSIPVGTPLTVTGGFLFGWLEGGSLSIVAATIGATLIFLATKTALADLLRAMAGETLVKMEDGLRKNAVFYLLFCRLVPVFPFFLVNIAAGLLDAPFVTYVVATFFGEMPVIFVYASLGSGLGKLFDRGQKPDLHLFTQPEVLLPLMGLALLVILPVLWRRFAHKPKQA